MMALLKRVTLGDNSSFWVGILGRQSEDWQHQPPVQSTHQVKAFPNHVSSDTQHVLDYSCCGGEVDVVFNNPGNVNVKLFVNSRFVYF